MRRPSLAVKKFNELIAASSLTMVVSFLMLLVDTIVVGNMLGENALSAVNIITPIYAFANFIAGLIGLGTAYAYSEALGRYDKNQADNLWGQSVILAAASGIAMMIFMMLFRDMYFDFMDVSQAVRMHAESYWQYEQFVVLLAPVLYLLLSMITNDYDDKLLMVANVVFFAGHIGFAILFTGWLGCGGASLGMVVGSVLCILVLLLHFFRKTNTLKFRWHFSIKDIAVVARLSIVDAVIYLCLGIMGFVLNKLVVVEFGDTYLPVLTLAFSVMEFALVFDGIGDAVAPLANLYLGEKNSVAEYRLIKYAMKVSIIEGVIMCIGVFACAPLVLRMFNVSDPEIIPDSLTAVRILALALPLTSVKYLLTSQYLYVRRIMLSAWMTVANDLVATTGLALLMGWIFGIKGIWWGFVLAAPIVLAAFGIYILLKYGRDMFPYLVNGRDDRVFDESIYVNPSETVKVRDEIGLFLDKNGIEPSSANKVMLLVEETFNIIMRENAGEKIIGEVTVCLEDEGIVLHIKDNGRMFDVTDTAGGSAASENIVYRKMMELHLPRAYMISAGCNRVTYTIL